MAGRGDCFESRSRSTVGGNGKAGGRVKAAARFSDAFAKALRTIQLGIPSARLSSKMDGIRLVTPGPIALTCVCLNILVRESRGAFATE